jgi:very-short-patch-repair endonuclease
MNDRGGDSLNEDAAGPLAARQDLSAQVLVAVLNNLRDFEIARQQGWYRIPVKRAPRRVAADYLAFYQTKAFGDEAWAVNYYAPVRHFRVTTRADLLPDEAGHARARDSYYKVEIGPLERLARPIPSRRLRRITFIPTTLGHLLAAQEINDLWWRDDPQERLWAALRDAGLLVEYRYQVSEAKGQAPVDFAIFCQDGRIAVLVDPDRHQEPDPLGDPDLREARPSDYELAAAGWHVLHFNRRILADDLPGCVGSVLAMVTQLGGQSRVLEGP